MSNGSSSMLLPATGSTITALGLLGSGGYPVVSLVSGICLAIVAVGILAFSKRQTKKAAHRS